MPFRPLRASGIYVGFGYEELEHIDLTVEPGQTVASLGQVELGRQRL